MTTDHTIESASPDQVTAAIATLKAAGYQIVEKFDPVDAYNVSDSEELAIGVVLDTETTGTDPEKDRIIELGMVFFEYHPETGVVYRIIDVFNGLRDPGMPIPPEASAVNGITDDMVKGLEIDAQLIEDRLTYVSIVVAHNASFDRAFCEKQWPFFATKAWACSFRQIAWMLEGFGSAKLDYIAYRRGFHFEAHRAEIDCRALLHVLQGPFADTGETTLKAMLDQCRVKEMRIWAMNSPFSVKDALKERGYYWGDGTGDKEKAWYCVIPEADVAAELEWLKVNAYGNKSSAVIVDTIDEFNRFSTRRNGTRREYI